MRKIGFSGLVLALLVLMAAPAAAQKTRRFPPRKPLPYPERLVGIGPVLASPPSLRYVAWRYGYRPALRPTRSGYRPVPRALIQLSSRPGVGIVGYRSVVERRGYRRPGPLFSPPRVRSPYTVRSGMRPIVPPIRRTVSVGPAAAGPPAPVRRIPVVMADPVPYR